MPKPLWLYLQNIKHVFIPLVDSFLILSILVTLNISISTTPNYAPCLFLTATDSKPANIAAFATIFCTYAVIPADAVTSHLTLYSTCLQPSFTRFFTSSPNYAGRSTSTSTPASSLNPLI